jgi:hypothetical protein
MAEKNKPDAAKVNESLALGGENVEGVTLAEAFRILRETKDSELQEMTGEYLSFEKVGETKDLYFTGLTTLTIDDKTMDAAQFTDETGQNFVYLGVVVVSACKRLTQVPCYVRLKYVSDEKSANGTYKNIRVFTFPNAAK